MTGKNILWIDDEIDLLRMHILFLKEKGHNTETVNNGRDALEILKEKNFDIIFLDENMPGKSGLDILPEIKYIRPAIPVVMITKNEEEDIMDEAIGDNIDDYLLKPVNPKQILLSIKKHADNKRIINNTVRDKYQNTFREISKKIGKAKSAYDWKELYRELIYWQLEIERTNDGMLNEILDTQLDEARTEFGKFIKNNYISWFNDRQDERPLMLHDFLNKKVKPLTDQKEKIFVIVIDNLRFDQWRMIRPIIERIMPVVKEEIWYSMLPTTTQYARNSLFAGMMPLNIEKLYPQYWKYDHEDGGKNEFERELAKEFFKRYRRDVNIGYYKVLENKFGASINNKITQMLKNDVTFVVYNFIDILSHARTDNKMVQELAFDLQQYRNLTKTWFQNSPLLDMLKKLAQSKTRTFILTDHGSVNINRALKVLGDRETTTNLRYKSGKNLNYDPKTVFEIVKPEQAGLPEYNLSQSYIFTTNNDFFAYPNNFNQHVRYYKDTFQHGGASPDEMLIPVVELKAD